MKFLSIGHLTYDNYIFLENFPVEGSKNVFKENTMCSGGSANNVAYALSKWNTESYISGVIGYDASGTAMKKNMEENRVITNFLETNYDIPTSVSYILMNRQNNTRTILTETNNTNIKKYEYDVAIDCIITDGTEYSASIYAFNKYVNAVTILNAKAPHQGLLDFFKYAKYAVCSAEVAEAMTGIKIDFNAPITLTNVYKKIAEKYPSIQPLIRIEGKGTIYSVNNEIKVLADIQSENKDVTGAHDTFVATIAYGLTKKYDLETTIRLATIASSLSKQAIGSTTATPLLSDIISYYESKFGKLNQATTPIVETSTEENVPAAK